jgi:hypothetical protein
MFGISSLYSTVNGAVSTMHPILKSRALGVYGLTDSDSIEYFFIATPVPTTTPTTTTPPSGSVNVKILDQFSFAEGNSLPTAVIYCVYSSIDFTTPYGSAVSFLYDNPFSHLVNDTFHMFTNNTSSTIDIPYTIDSDNMAVFKIDSTYRFSDTYANTSNKITSVT